MKKLILIIFCFSSLYLFAQKKNKLFINGGVSAYNYMLENKKNFNIFASFHHQSKKEKWTMEYYFLYSQNDNFPDFFTDQKALDDFIVLGNLETIYEDTKWRNVQNYEIGSKVHYSFFKNTNLSVSCNIGIGVRMYNSTDFYLLSIDKDDINNSFTYSSATVYGTGGYGFAIFPGVHLDYELGKNFLLALDSGYHQDIASNLKYNENNGTFWNYSIGIGKRF